jgi:DNA-directed RNA polymerase specialized sigma24 family protein
VPTSDPTSHRRTPEPALLTALRERDPQALAETLHRTLPAAHAVARRLLPPADVESLLGDVYSDLWGAPPLDRSLERWLRGRTATLGLSELRDRGTGPAAPSVCTVAEYLAPATTELDGTERTLAALPLAERHALLLAHDLGVPSSAQGADDAGRSLTRALLALSGDAGAHRAHVDGGDEGDGLVADWVLGLLAADEVDRLAEALAEDPERAALAEALHRGRRQLEDPLPEPELAVRLRRVVTAGAGAGDEGAIGGSSGVDGTRAAEESATTSVLGEGVVADDRGHQRVSAPDDAAVRGRSALDATAPATASRGPDDGSGSSAAEKGPDDAADGGAPTQRSPGSHLARSAGLLLFVAIGIGLGLLVGQLIVDLTA